MKRILCCLCGLLLFTHFVIADDRKEKDSEKKQEIKADLEIIPHKCASPCEADLKVTFKKSSDQSHILKYIFSPEAGMKIESDTPVLHYKYVYFREQHKKGHEDEGKKVFKGEVELVLDKPQHENHALKDEIVVEGKPNTPPTAVLNMPSSLKVNRQGTFDASLSSDLENKIKSYLFDFGNGETREGTSPIVEYSYATPGKYSVSLTVTDQNDLSSSLSKNITIVPNQPPIINLALTPGTPYYAPVKITASLLGSTDSDGTIQSQMINWGDGTISSSQNAEHQYNEPGSFQITGSITDDDGAVVTQNITVEVKLNLPPVAKIISIPGTSKGSYKLDASTSSDPDGSIVAASWNIFGVTKSGMELNEVFPVGSSTISLTVTDNLGKTSTSSINIFVPEDEVKGGGLAGVDSGDVGVAPSDIQIAPSAITPPALIEGVFKPISQVVEISDTNHPGGVVYPSGMVKLQFKYDPAVLTNLNLLANFMVFYQATDQTWKRANFIEVDPANHIVYAYTNHLTPFVLTAKQDVVAPIIALESFENNFSDYRVVFSVNDSDGVDYSKLWVSMNGQVLPEHNLTVDPILNSVAIKFSTTDSFVLFNMYNTLTIKVPDLNQNLSVKGMAFKVEANPSSPVRFSFTPGGGELTTTTPVVHVSMESESALDFSSFEARLNNIKIPASLITINQASKEVTITFNQDNALSTTNFSILTVQIATTLHQQASGMVGFDTMNRSVQVLVGANQTVTAAGGHHTCAILTNGGLRCFGDNTYGQLGYPGVANVGLTTSPASVGDVVLVGTMSTVMAKKVVTGDKHTCVLLTSGDVRCFGDASFGKLGVGATLGTQTKIGDDEFPSTINTVSLGGPAIDLVAGREHTCALMQDQTIRCWGLGTSGQLGNGRFENIGDDELPSSIPAITIGTGGVGPTIKITTGAFHTCVLRNNDIYCTGENSVGQLGLGDTVNRASFTRLEGTPPTTAMMQLVAGAFHTCIGGAGNIAEFYCWGEGSFGKLGRGMENIGDNELPFMGVNLDNNIRDLMMRVFSTGGVEGELALGDNHTCIRGGEGAVGCFGRADQGAWEEFLIRTELS